MRTRRVLGDGSAESTTEERSRAPPTVPFVRSFINLFARLAGRSLPFFPSSSFLLFRTRISDDVSLAHSISFAAPIAQRVTPLPASPSRPRRHSRRVRLGFRSMRLAERRIYTVIVLRFAPPLHALPPSVRHSPALGFLFLP